MQSEFYQLLMLGNKVYTPQYHNRAGHSSTPNNRPRPSIMPNNIGRPNYSNRPYFSDPKTLSRVNLYLQNNGRNGKIDYDHMVDELRREYREYSRKKRWAFKNHVIKAVEVLMLENSFNDESEVIEDDTDVEETEPQGRGSPDYTLGGDNGVNSALENSYIQQSAKKRKTEDEVQKTISVVTLTSDEEETVAKTDEVDKKEKKKEHLKIKDLESSIATPGPLLNENQPSKKRRAEQSLLANKRFKSSLEHVQPSVTFKDIGGNEKVLKEVTQMLIHMRHPEVYRVLGVSPPRGFLLHGPPGSGKTLLANAIAGELKLPLLKVAAPELVGGLSGQSEERIRELFQQAVALAPCILFIDEVDSITPNRETAHREMERRIVAQLLASMDELASNEKGDQVLVIGATNRPDSLDPALRRAGRFDREVCLGIPDRESRSSILETLCNSLRLSPEVQFSDLAMMTPGYVAADLKSLVTEAAMAAVNRLFKTLQETEIELKSQDTKSELKLQDSESKPKTQQELNNKKDNLDNMEEPILMEVTEQKNNIEDNSVNLDEDDSKIEDDKELIVVDECGETDIPDSELPASTSKNIAEIPIEVNENSEDAEIQVVNNEETSSNDVEVLEVQQTEKKLPDAKVQIVNNEESDSTEIDVLKVQHTENNTPDYLRKEDKTPDIPSLLHSAPLSVEQLQGIYITMEDFKVALKSVQPSAKREGFATVPDVKWDDIGSLKDIRNELEMAILAPVKYPAEFAKMGLQQPTGVLLCGPPGCGKTLLAKAVANEAGINFISVKGPELLNMYVGESERAVRQCFQRARSSQPCVIFFDEIDALAPKRTHMENGASRVVNQLLTEMDGVEARNGVFLMAATNRPDIVDPAVMRPGRLDKVLYVGLPAAEDRVDILRALTKGGKQPVLDVDVDLDAVGRDPRCEGYTGADMAALVREASMQALKEFMSSSDSSFADLKVCQRHFTSAMAKIRPSVTERDRKRYEDLRVLYAAVPVNNK